MKRHGTFFVYIIQEKNGTFYTGYTQDIDNRLNLHTQGKGAKYLRGRQPLKLVFVKKYAYYKNAINGEIHIKTLTRKQKEKLILQYENNRC